MSVDKERLAIITQLHSCHFNEEFKCTDLLVFKDEAVPRVVLKKEVA